MESGTRLFALTNDVRAKPNWKTQTGERALFWCTVLFFTQADGQCFIAPTIVHQGSELTANMFWGIPGNWVSHVMPSGYMDRDGWYKTINNFSKMSGKSSKSPVSFL
jgi:hypothetical protein